MSDESNIDYPDRDKIYPLYETPGISFVAVAKTISGSGQLFHLFVGYVEVCIDLAYIIMIL